MAVVAGLLYGASFVPILYIKSHAAVHDSICYGASLYGEVLGGRILEAVANHTLNSVVCVMLKRV